MLDSFRVLCYTEVGDQGEQGEGVEKEIAMVVYLVVEKYAEMPGVVIFSKKGCKACEKAKEFFGEFLDRAIVVYISVDMLPKEHRRKIAKLIRDKAKELNTDVTYPIILVDGRMMFGFYPEVFK